MFQSKVKNLQRRGDVFFDILITRKGASVCSNTYRNFNGRLNKTWRMYPAQTMTTEWKAEKCLNKRVQSKQTRKHKLGNRTNRQADVRCHAQAAKSSLSSNGNNAKGNRVNTYIYELIFNLRISREFEFILFVYTVRNIPNRICKNSFKIHEKKN